MHKTLSLSVVMIRNCCVWDARGELVLDLVLAKGYLDALDQAIESFCPMGDLTAEQLDELDELCAAYIDLETARRAKARRNRQNGFA